MLDARDVVIAEPFHIGQRTGTCSFTLPAEHGTVVPARDWSAAR